MMLDELNDVQLREIFPAANEAVRLLCTTEHRLAEVHYTMRD
jgi:hypothetical protein